MASHSTSPTASASLTSRRFACGAAERIGKRPILALSGEWPSPPRSGEQVMFAGFPGQERIVVKPAEISFGFHSGMSAASAVTGHQITQRFERESMLDHHGNGLPPKGYGLGGISGGPLLVPDYHDGGWTWRLGGVISQATEERPPEEVIFEMVIAHRAEYIQPDGTLAKSL